MAKAFVSKYVLVDGKSAFLCADALTICRMEGISKYKLNQKLKKDGMAILNVGVVYSDVINLSSKRGGKYGKKETGVQF